jgi:hypothetical protein
LTASGRQQLAYARYVRKQTHNRVKMQTKFKKVKIPNAAAAEPKMSGTRQGPQSVSSSEAPLTPPSGDGPQTQGQ